MAQATKSMMFQCDPQVAHYLRRCSCPTLNTDHATDVARKNSVHQTTFVFTALALQLVVARLIPQEKSGTDHAAHKI